MSGWPYLEPRIGDFVARTGRVRNGDAGKRSAGMLLRCRNRSGSVAAGCAVVVPLPYAGGDGRGGDRARGGVRHWRGGIPTSMPERATSLHEFGWGVPASRLAECGDDNNYPDARRQAYGYLPQCTKDLPRCTSEKENLRVPPALFLAKIQQVRSGSTSMHEPDRQRPSEPLGRTWADVFLDLSAGRTR